MLAMILANANRDPKTTPEPFQPADFFRSIPRVEADDLEDANSEANVLAMLDSMVAATGGRRE
jgi:hypothetical protein